MAVVEMTEEDAEDGNKWRSMENPLWRPPTGEDKRRRKRIIQ